jgi:pentatricopeptide repeat protein
MMDIYANARQFDVVETMFHGIKNPGTVEYNILVKAYGKCLRPEHAEEVVRRMIDNPRSPKPDTHTITSLLNAWAESSTKYGNAAERAYNVFRWFYDDPKVVALQLLPNVVTYTILLKCLATSDSVNRENDMGQKVEAILKEVESQYISGDTSFKPNEYLCNTAINALLSANDLYRAEALLKRMEQSSHHLSEGKAMEYVQPTAITYNTFLIYFSKMHTTEAAERAEQLLHHMRKLSQLTIPVPLAKPNHYSYAIVLNAWAACGSPESADRMWKVYEEMVHVDKLSLVEGIANVLVKFLSNSKNTIDLSRSLQLLRNVNDYKQIQICSLVYCQVLHCCMKMNDHKSAVQVVKLLFDACLTGRCRFDVAPDRAQLNWLLNRWLAFDQLTEATLFLETLMQISSRTTKTSKLLYLEADYNTVLDLRKAWTASSHPEKQYYIAKMDIEILPAIMHASNFRNGNVRQFGFLF